MSVQPADLNDPALVSEVDLARAAAQEEAGDERVGDHVSYQIEDEAAVTHLFEADKPGYHGWRWAVTITSAGPDTDVTVSEVVLLPGPSALVAPDWIPWQNRVRAGDLGVGDLLPIDPDDPRLVPAYLETDDPAVEEVAMEVGLGRTRVMARPARLDTAARWHESEFGPRSDMARSAPAHCGTCGFYLPLAGSLRAAFGTCGNELSPADAHVVHAEYGCGAHSETDIEQVSPVLVADLIYDDALLDVEPLASEEPPPAAEPEQAESAEQPESVESADQPEAPASVALATEPATSAEPVSVPDQPADAAPPAESTELAESAELIEPAEPVEPAESMPLADSASLVDELSAPLDESVAPEPDPVVAAEPALPEDVPASAEELPSPADASVLDEAEPVAAVEVEQPSPVDAPPLDESSADEPVAPAEDGADQLVAFPEIGAPVTPAVTTVTAETVEAVEAEAVPLDADQLAAFPEIGGEPVHRDAAAEGTDEES